MEPDSQVQRQKLAELPTESPDAAAPVEVSVSTAGAARSNENISQWMSYLPADCVDTMIEMGWDVTT